MKNMYKLNQNSGMAEASDRISAVLYPHQKTLLHATLNIEKTNGFKDSSVQITNGAAVVSKFGSGKTLVEIALALSGQTPNAVPNFVETPHCKVSIEYKYMIDSTFIIVSKTVFTQFAAEIARFAPSARVLKLNTHADLRKLEIAFSTNTKYLDQFDIILVKAGTETGTFDLMPANAGTKSILNVVNTIIYGYVVKRAIYDDIDIVQHYKNARCIPALFSHYFSATGTEQKPDYGDKNLFNRMLPRVHTITNSHIPKIENDQSFVDKSLRVPKVAAFRYVYANAGDNAIKLIGIMGAAETEHIAELINGDSIEEAARAVGIVSDNAVSVFEKLLGSKYDTFRRETIICDSLAAAITTASNAPHGEHCNNAEIDRICHNALKSAVVVPWYDADLIEKLKELERTHRELLNTVSLHINRVKENIKAGSCTICCLPLDGENVIINKCCGIILCGDCGIKGAKIRKQYDETAERDQLYGKCPNCDKRIDMSNGMVFISADFDVNDLINQKGIAVEDEEIVAAPAPERSELEIKLESIKTPKQRALLEILTNTLIDPKVRQSFTYKSPNMIDGVEFVESTRQKKILVFTGSDTSIDKIETMINEQRSILESVFGSTPRLTQRLMGKTTEIANTCADFAAGKFPLLLVNAHHHCAGLNLECATDIVFYHRIRNRDIEAQVAGRGQRIGRTDSLRLHFLLYGNEDKD